MTCDTDTFEQDLTRLESKVSDLADLVEIWLDDLDPDDAA